MPAYDETRFAPPAPLARVVLRHPDSGEIVIEAEIGVLGRDVLNNVRVVLDGPGLQWEESRPPAKLS